MSEEDEPQTDPGTVASSHDTVDEIVRLSGRDAVPIRNEFLQVAAGDGIWRPGPLASFVTATDQRALTLYLLAVTKASGGGFEVRLGAAVWARALGLWDPTGKTATSTISKAWLRIERRRLIERRRRKRMVEVQLLREDGSGGSYENPGAVQDRHFKLPHAFWSTGPTADQRWYEVLNLSEVAMLLIARSLADAFRLPLESVPAWYGISADTASRGLKGLVDHGLLERRVVYKKAPLAPAGYTAEHLYTLRPPFGPKGVRSQAARRMEQS